MADDERIISVFCVFLCFLWKVLSVVKKFWKLKDLENVWKFKGCECLLAGQILVGVTIQLIPGEIVVVLSPGLAVLNLRGVGNLGDPMRVPNATCGCCRPWRHRKFSCGTPGMFLYGVKWVCVCLCPLMIPMARDESAPGSPDNLSCTDCVVWLLFLCDCLIIYVIVC